MLKDRLLYFAPNIPGLVGGNKLRAFQQIKILSNRFNVVLVIVSYENMRDIPDYLFNYCEDIKFFKLNYLNKLKIIKGVYDRNPLQIEFYRNKKVEQSIKSLINEYSNIKLVFVSHIRMVNYFKIIKNILNVPALFDFIDCYSRRFYDMSKVYSGFMKMIYKFEANTLQRFELATLDLFDKSIITTTEDRAQIRDDENLYVFPQMVSLPKISEDQKEKEFSENILFFANMASEVNISSVFYFYNKIFKKILDKKPKCQLWIVGSNPPESLLKLSKSKNVIVTGFMQSLDQVYGIADVVISPLVYGSGIKNRVLEAMAYKLPVVATRLSNDGINAVEEEEILIGDSPESFANHVIRLLENEFFRKRLGVNSRKLIENNFSEEIMKEKYNKIITELLNSHE